MRSILGTRTQTQEILRTYRFRPKARNDSQGNRENPPQYRQYRTADLELQRKRRVQIRRASQHSREFAGSTWTAVRHPGFRSQRDNRSIHRLSIPQLLLTPTRENSDRILAWLPHIRRTVQAPGQQQRQSQRD